MPSATSIKGIHSQLIAASALLASGYNVSEPLVPESSDFIIYKDGQFLKAQVKTIFLRKDKLKDYYVIFARKGDGKEYTTEEIDIIIGVYQDQVYLVKNTGQQEYWCQPEQASTKWELVSPFIKEVM